MIDSEPKRDDASENIDGPGVGAGDDDELDMEDSEHGSERAGGGGRRKRALPVASVNNTVSHSLYAPVTWRDRIWTCELLGTHLSSSNRDHQLPPNDQIYRPKFDTSHIIRTSPR